MTRERRERRKEIFSIFLFRGRTEKLFKVGRMLNSQVVHSSLAWKRWRKREEEIRTLGGKTLEISAKTNNGEVENIGKGRGGKEALFLKYWLKFKFPFKYYFCPQKSNPLKFQVLSNLKFPLNLDFPSIVKLPFKFIFFGISSSPQS